MYNRNGRTEKAVRETIRICRDQNVLKDYLAKEEVPNIMFGAFDKEFQLELLRETDRAEGREEGREEEKLASIQLIMKKMQFSARQAMEFLEISSADQPRYLAML